jgi:hypothetical protein
MPVFDGSAALRRPPSPISSRIRARSDSRSTLKARLAILVLVPSAAISGLLEMFLGVLLTLHGLLIALFATVVQLVGASPARVSGSVGRCWQPAARASDVLLRRPAYALGASESRRPAVRRGRGG